MHIDTSTAAADTSLPDRLGLIRMTGGSGPDDDIERITTVRSGLEAGITRIHTADYAGMGYDELLLREALRGLDRAQVQLSVSFGVLCDPSGAVQDVDTRPAAVKSALAYSLRRLGTDYIDTYRPARLSPDVPVEDTVGAIAELVQAGYVRNVGLGDVGPETLRRAAAA